MECDFTVPGASFPDLKKNSQWTGFNMGYRWRGANFRLRDRIACMVRLSGKPLAGKVALITGGARRLGRASALVLAEAGADVAITFRTSAREAQRGLIDLRDLGVRAVALPCDVTDES